MSEKINSGGPAFPGGVNSVYTNIDAGETTQTGMTLRDYFAAQVVGHCFTDLFEDWRLGQCERPNESWPDNVATVAYRVADAMIRVRESQPYSVEGGRK